ncbi:hypothetical protein OG523_00945 [Streptomyces virginiae]|uniref:hypothetical protein n=1 Tax=Streptomyces virginiae TaxID=1961 RepID=UPI002E353047|nr:hypothetical protein [Streptomyces virginiae]
MPKSTPQQLSVVHHGLLVSRRLAVDSPAPAPAPNAQSLLALAGEFACEHRPQAHEA